MQTFLPFPNFIESAKALDKKRCWKQVVEAKQIIETLEKKRSKAWGMPYKGTDYSNLVIGWENHPAVKMWEGHTWLLKYYYNAFLKVCIEIHKINTNLSRFSTKMPTIVDNPWWLGNEDFHRAMRARLIEKDEEFYLPKFPLDKGFNGGKYFWPNMDGTKTFRII